MALDPLHPTTIGACIEGTAGSATGTTAVALPAGASPGTTLLVANTGSVLAFLKLGPSTGPDATDTTTGGGRAPLPAGSVQVFTVKAAQTHAYLYAASNSTYSLMAADGE